VKNGDLLLIENDRKVKLICYAIKYNNVLSVICPAEFSGPIKIKQHLHSLNSMLISLQTV
jgi:hypothetical protein